MKKFPCDISSVRIISIVCIAFVLLITAFLARPDNTYAEVFNDIDTIIEARSNIVYIKKTDGSFWIFDDSSIAKKYPEDDIKKYTFSYGNNHLALLKNNGTLYMRGGNLRGQLGDGTTEGHGSFDFDKPVLFDDNADVKIDDVILGNYYSAAITSDGDLYVWGCNNKGQVGNGTTEDQLVPYKVLSNVRQVCLGRYHSAAVTNDGILYTWGYNNYGQLGYTTIGADYSSTPRVAIKSGVKMVDMGDYHTAAVTEDGSLLTWGNNKYGQLGNGTIGNQTIPEDIQLTGIDTISLEANYSAAVDKDGRLWMWGENLYDQFGTDISGDQYEPVYLLDNVNMVCLSGTLTSAKMKDGTFSVWGLNAGSPGEIIGSSVDDSKLVASGITSVKSISLGDNHSIALRADGSVYSWGSNNNRQLGYMGMDWKFFDSSEYYSLASHPYGFIHNNIKSISAGYDNTGVITEDDDLFIWGSAIYRYKKYGKYSPSEAVKIDSVKQVSFGQNFAAVIKNDNSLWLWGYNDYGQIGDGTQDKADDLVWVMDNVKQVSLGEGFSAAVKYDGSLYMWGKNNRGQLGDGTTEDKASPCKVTEISSVASICMHGNTSAAITEDGGLYMWGYGFKSYPERILNKVKSVSLGKYHYAALKTNGILYMRGDNGKKQIRNEEKEKYSSFEPVMEGVEQVSLGSYHTGVIKTDGSILLWGSDEYGQLGDGVIGDGSAPADGSGSGDDSGSGSGDDSGSGSGDGGNDGDTDHSGADTDSNGDLEPDTADGSDSNESENAEPSGESNSGSDNAIPADNMPSDNDKHSDESSPDSKADGGVEDGDPENNSSGQVNNESTDGSSGSNVKDSDKEQGRIPISNTIIKYRKTMAYTGKARKALKYVLYRDIKLKKGTDYTIKYKSNKKIGKAHMIIAGKGKYSGSVKIQFRIIPDRARIKRVKNTLNNDRTSHLTIAFSAKALKDKRIRKAELQLSVNKHFTDNHTYTVKKSFTKRKTEGKINIDTYREPLVKGKKYYIRIRLIKNKSYKGKWSKAFTVIGKGN